MIADDIKNAETARYLANLKRAGEVQKKGGVDMTFYKDDDIVEKAAKLSKLYHGEQTRKYTGEPYWTHPEAVAGIVQTVTHTDEMLAAAWLHDLVEDVEVVSHGFILQEFGPVIFSYVYFLTDISRPGDGNRKVRKAMDRRHNAHGPAEAQTIKVADLIHNSESITECDPDFAVVYMKEKAKTLEGLYKADPRLLAQAGRLIDAWNNRDK